MAGEKLTKTVCLALLREKYAALQAAGASRYPKRADFSEREVVAIKAFFGPWPRALEAAGIKPPRADDAKQRRMERRIDAKRRRTQMKKQKKQNEESQKGIEK